MVLPVLAVVSFADEADQHPCRSSAFSKILHLKQPGGCRSDGIAARRVAVEAAAEAGADWLMLLAPGESLAEGALEIVRPALNLYDAIFGAVHVVGSDEQVATLSRLAFDTADRLPHALLRWWMPASHLVRTGIAGHMVDRLDRSAGRHWHLDYLFAIWQSARCLKAAQPLLKVRSAPEPLDADGREEVLRRLAATPVFLPVMHGEEVYHLPYTGRNAGIEHEQSRGLFFEAAELQELHRLVGPGARVADVGANTGNHTVFFAGPMRAREVIPFEPLPEAVAAMRRAISRNRLGNVDLSRLGIGIADQPGRARLAGSERGGLGATSLTVDPSGEIALQPLDAVLAGPVDLLKIDVEGMEMNVLAGARAVLATSRPRIFIEIASRNTPAFADWLDAARYRIDRIFSDKGHANYLASPIDAG